MIGLDVSNLEYEKGNWKTSIGIDLRNYKGYHYRVVNDLLGLDGYYSTGNDNSAGQIINTLVEINPFKDTGLNILKSLTTMLVKLVGKVLMV